MPLVWSALSLAGAIVVLYFVLSPLRGKRAEQIISSLPAPETSTPEARRVSDLLDQREAALAGLAELDFDRNLGNLSEADYGQLREQYRAQAVGILHALDNATLPELKSARNLELGTRNPEPKIQNPKSAMAEAQRQVSRRALWSIGGVIAVALLAIVAGTMALRGSAAPAAEDAPALNILHAHATLLAPGTEAALLGHHSGLLRSENGGRSWAAVAGVKGDVLALAAAPNQGATIFLATADALMQSSDGGLTWTQLPLPRSGAQVSVLAVGEGTPLPLYAGVESMGLFRTTDLKTWQLIGGGLPTSATSMVWRPGMYAALYASGPRDGLVATGDGGQTWGSANGTLNGVLPTLAVRAVAVDTKSGDRFTMPDGTEMTGAMYVATDLGLFKSIDGGSSWSGMPLRVPLATVSARALPSPLMLAVDSRGRVWRSTDRGRTWSAKP